MNTLSAFYHSSIGKKFIVGLTGVCLCIYLVVHLAGNLLLFKNDGGVAFDRYAELLPSLLIILIIEKILFAIFIIHILIGTIVWTINKFSRPQKYLVNKPQENSSFSSRWAFVTGSIVFIFLVIHVRTFWFTSRFQAGDHFSMYALVKESFSSPIYSSFYVIAMFLLGFHLRHGFQSVFQTFGLKTTKYTPLIEAVGVIFWLLIPIGFAIIPIYFFLNS